MNKWIALVAACWALPAAADYRVIPYGASYSFEFSLRSADASTVTSGLTLEAGDCLVSEDASADSNCDTLPTAIAMTNKYSFTVSAAEATGLRVSYMLKDADSTDYFAREFVFDTCGNAMARFASCVDTVGTAVGALNDLSAADVRNIVIEDQGGGVTLGCAIAVVLAYAMGDLTTTGSTSTFKDPSGAETRGQGTVASAGNRAASITCPTY